MTIAVWLKVQDGLVLAADSAASLVAADPASGTQTVTNVYDNANKIVNLRKGHPLGIMFWGAGGIGNSSMTTLAKDLREDLRTRYTPNVGYTIGVMASEALTFFRAAPGEKQRLGFCVAGYSSGSQHAECYEVTYDEDAGWRGPTEVLKPDGFGSGWRGQPEWISRLVFGFGEALPKVLVEGLGLPVDQLEQAMTTIRESTEVSLLHPAMPIQDVIELARFLVELTKTVVRFLPGGNIVGGPVEIAAITKHEGFKWVQRKHYFSMEFNVPTEAS